MLTGKKARIPASDGVLCKDTHSHYPSLRARPVHGCGSAYFWIGKAITRETRVNIIPSYFTLPSIGTSN